MFHDSMVLYLIIGVTTITKKIVKNYGSEDTL